MLSSSPFLYAVQNMHSLKTLDVSGNSLIYSDVYCLCFVLKNVTSVPLQRLSLSNNQVGCKGALLVAELLSERDSIQHISVANAAVSTHGMGGILAVVLDPSLKTSPKFVDLRANEADIPSIPHLLTLNAQLVTERLSETVIQLDGNRDQNGVLGRLKAEFPSLFHSFEFERSAAWMHYRRT